MKEIVINSCFGGFSLSTKATEAYLACKGKKVYWFTEARDSAGRLDFDAPMVPCPNPDGEIIAHSYTTPKPKPRNDKGYFSSREIDRDDPDLVAIVSELGDAASGRFAELTIVRIPDDVDWEIAEYDGLEHVAEKHRTWSE